MEMNLMHCFPKNHETQIRGNWLHLRGTIALGYNIFDRRLFIIQFSQTENKRAFGENRLLNLLSLVISIKLGTNDWFPILNQKRWLYKTFKFEYDWTPIQYLTRTIRRSNIIKKDKQICKFSFPKRKTRTLAKWTATVQFIFLFIKMKLCFTKFLKCSKQSCLKFHHGSKFLARVDDERVNPKRFGWEE